MNSHTNTIRGAAIAGVVEAHAAVLAHTETFRTWSRKRQSVVILGALAILALAISANAFAAGCGGSATDKLIKFIDNAAKFMIAIGGASALLMFAVGALFIIIGGTQERVGKGMKMIKNSVIGLIFLAGGAFIKTIVTTFVKGASSGSGSACVERGKGFN